MYYTDKNGEGIFFQSDRTGQTKQLVGTCQFKACETASGTRRKLNKIFDDMYEAPDERTRQEIQRMIEKFENN